ncbi:MAG: TlpA disulfide reductase family protein [Hornefia sp.]|nr:TlpA disulfide reductase family protein [Hornefia sp.]
MKKGFKKFICIISAMLLLVPLAACGSKDIAADSQFPAFKAEDFSGNNYTEKVFGESDATVINFWYTGCQSCITEMPDLEKTAKKLAEKNVKFLGICTDAGEEGVDKEVRKILKTSKVTFPTLKIKEGEKMNELVKSINSFPTTVVVDKKGKIVGDPILGAINDAKQEKEINERIEKAKSRNK